MLAVGRIPLLCYAFKDKRVLKAFLYYETVYEMIGHFLPQKAYADDDAGVQTWMLMTMCNFILFQTNFKLALSMSVLSLVSFLTGTSLVYTKDINVLMLILHSLFLLVWLVITLGLIH